MADFEKGEDMRLPKIPIKIWLVLGGLFLLASLAWNGWGLWEKEKGKIYQQGQEQGRQEVNNFIIGQLQTTGRLQIKINTSEGEKVIVLIPQP